MAGHVALGMDMGGTNLRLGIVSRDGELCHSVAEPLVSEKSVERVVEQIVEGIQGLQRWCGENGFEAGSVCLAAPGIISREEGTIVFSPNLPGWRDVPLRDIISRMTGLPALLENDANAAAFGEFWKGGGRGARHLVMLTLGTGVGGGIISDGRLVRGSRGMAAELGHITVVTENGRLCRCGNHGCLEAYASGTAIVERVAERWTDRDPPATAQKVFDLAREGNADCREVFREAGYHLGVAMADIVNVLNPEAIIIGGRVAAAWDFMVPAAEEQMRSRSFKFTDLAERVSVRKAELGDSAGLIGSAGVFWCGEGA